MDGDLVRAGESSRAGNAVGLGPDTPDAGLPDSEVVGARPDLAFAVLRGRPSAEELAAVTVVLRTVLAQSCWLAAPTAPRSWWSARDRLVRRPLRRGPGAWRASVQS